jgi:diguanylate cyclase (GGDEF)-like protein/PAS domain S-box-containing protein
MVLKHGVNAVMKTGLTGYSPSFLLHPVQKLMLILVCLTVLSFSSLGWSQSVITVESGQSNIDLRPILQWQVSDNNAQLSDLQSNNNWQASVSELRVSAKHSLWGKIQLDFPLDNVEQYALTVGNPQLDFVDVYVVDDKNRILSAYLMGARRDFSQRPIAHRLFVAPVRTSQQSQISVYIKVATQGPLVFPVTLSIQSDALSYEQALLAFMGFVSGGLTLLACYFLMTYMFLRSPVRFWFAVATSLFLLLLLNILGIVSQISGITAYIVSVNSVLCGMLLLAVCKVTFAILERVPVILRYCAYLLGFSTIACAFIADSFFQLRLNLWLAVIAAILITVLAGIYYKRDKLVPNLLAAVGFLMLGGMGFAKVVLFISGSTTSTQLDLFMISTSIGGILLIALAIEAHERVITQRQHLRQQSTISDLQHFYNLFRNSAEGLFTSTVDGKLITVNPAMCNLFGYEDEAHMLANIRHAGEFYADPHDRELLLGEIVQNGKVLGKEIKGLRHDGAEFWFCISAQIKQENDSKLLFGSIFDITERKQSDISLAFLATHDSLTGVFNRREFEKRLQSALSNAQLQNSDLTLLYLDLDQFKVVNDTCGHKAGDLLIKQLSQKLQDTVRDKGLLARLGGDEFGVLLEGDNAQMAYLVANQLLNVVQEFRFIWENRIFSLGVSIGQVAWMAEIKSPEQRLSMADAACYMAKEQGRNQVHTYSAEDEKLQRYASQLSWVADINQALQHDGFELYYQHYQSLKKSDDGHHYEILLRMRGKDADLIPPNAFLPTAERYNLTAQIDRWVIEHYFRWLSANPEHLAQLSRCNINLSGHSLADKDLKLFILNAFETYSVPYTKICFEITESMAIIKMDETLDFMRTFHALGCVFALDDFGSGFSSYTYLKTLPVDQLKIDGSFVKDILLDPIDLAMVNSIKDVAKAMGMETVAEFVESTEILVELGKMGVDYAQGYGVAKPQALTQFSALK